MLGNRGTARVVSGSRGGKDQFNWEDIKNDQHRTNYLGNSLLAPVGRWQRGKDLSWFTKINNSQNVSIEEEKRRIREQEEEMLNEAIGIKNKKKRHLDNSNSVININDPNIKKYLTRESNGVEHLESDRVRGLGGENSSLQQNVDPVPRNISAISQSNSTNENSTNTERQSSDLNLLIADKNTLSSIISKLKKSDRDDKSPKSKHDKKDSKHKHKHKNKRHDKYED